VCGIARVRNADSECLASHLRKRTYMVTIVVG